MKDKIIPHQVKPGIKRIPNIKNIIAVTSGKGGVGKSTVAINFALSLQQNGANVGILDADIYGPSIPMLVGERKFKPEVAENNFVPLDKYGIKVLSFGFLVDELQPTIWRGAIVNKALDQLLFDTNWGDLDYLIIDMPPGTGDIHLTMCQKMPITGVVVVTTPQDIALIDVIKSVEMYKKLSIPILGVVENMSTHICSKCNHVESIFGENGGDDLAMKYNLQLLGKLPLDIELRLSCDKGIPAVITNNKIQQLYQDITNNFVTEISKLPKDYSVQLGKINVIKS